MRIFDAFHAAHHDLSAAGFSLDKEYDQLLADYQARWDRGDRFDLSAISPMEMFDDAAWQRDPANEDTDLAACLQQLADELKGKLLARWAKQYSHDQMVAMINMLGCMDYNGTLRMWGTPIQYDELIAAWNAAHPTETPIQRFPSIEV